MSQCECEPAKLRSSCVPVTPPRIASWLYKYQCSRGPVARGADAGWQASTWGVHIPEENVSNLEAPQGLRSLGSLRIYRAPSYVAPFIYVDELPA